MNNLTVINNKPTSLLVGDYANQIKEMTRKVMRMTPGGKRLNADQALELAVYCWVNQLNPFEGEAYFALEMNQVLPGIAGYRRKATEYMQRIYGSGGNFWLEYSTCEPGVDAVFDPAKGDIAWRAILHDSSTKSTWLGQLTTLYQSLREVFPNPQEAWRRAEEMVGAEPNWQGIVIVYGSETFSSPGKPEKFDRN